jgi:hypothetical protein
MCLFISFSYCVSVNPTLRRVLDVGCSVGVSTSYLAQVEFMTGIYIRYKYIRYVFGIYSVYHVDDM